MRITSYSVTSLAVTQRSTLCMCCTCLVPRAQLLRVYQYVLCSILLSFSSYYPRHMAQPLEYQERYRQPAHEASITCMALSLDGHRLVTGSIDCTVLVWSVQSGRALCRMKSHSPVLSVVWLRKSNGFLFGCKNGMMASVDISEVQEFKPTRLEFK